MEYNFYAGLTIVACIFTIAIMVLYSLKKKELSVENRYFNIIMNHTLVSVLLEIYIQNYMGIINVPQIVNDIIHKISITNNEVYCLTVLIYTTLKCTYANDDDKTKKHKADRMFMIGSLIVFISIISFIFLGIDYHYNMEGTGVLYVSGSAVNVAFFVCGIFLLHTATVLIKKVIKERKEMSRKKGIWNAVIIGMSFALLAYQAVDQTFTACQFVQTYILILLYFNIENPDIKLAERVQEAKLKAEEINTNKNNFLSNMSHEIRTPLNAIMGLSKNILTYEELPVSLKEDVNDIILASTNLLEIVGNIIDINKMETEINEIKESPYNFKAELQSLVKVIGTRINEKPIALGIMMDPTIPDELIGDKYCIKTIVNNLLTNAIMYTDKGQITVTMKMLNMTEETCDIQLSVVDTGRGMKQEDVSNLFNKLETIKFDQNSEDSKSGLGLSVVNKIINLMGGRIEVKSAIGEGTTFDVFFSQKISPTYLQNKLAANVEKTDVATPETSIDSYKGLRMLIVDDNKINIKVARRNTEDLGFEIDDCDNGQSCIDKVKEGNHYYIILMDIMMPVMDGVEALKELKKIEGFDTPVVALTADAIAGSQEKYLEDGFSSYVSKPFTKEQIKKTIDSLLKSTL